MPTVGVADCECPEKGTEMTPEDYGAFKGRMFAQLDRLSDNSVNFTHILNMQYAGAASFRDATSARIVLEAGSGRTRAETNNPDATSAAGNARAGTP